MKLHSFVYEIFIFSLIFCFCVVPPFFTTVTPDNSILRLWSFPLQQVLFCCFAIWLYIITRPILLTKSKKDYGKLNFFYNFLFPATNSFCWLFCIAFIIKAISMIFPSAGGSQSIYARPDTFVKWIFCILTFSTGAFYEEVLYRFYLPETILHLLHYRFEKKWLDYLCEFLCMLLFAFAHIYGGALSVINAAFAHVVLRIFFRKTQSIWPVFAAHFFYNIISFILL